MKREILSLQNRTALEVMDRIHLFREMIQSIQTRVQVQDFISKIQQAAQHGDFLHQVAGN